MMFPLAGNEKVKRSVESFLKTGRLPHALIITGEAGLGKHTLAKYIAKAAVCSGAEKPCGQCKNCLCAESDNHPDIITVLREKDKKEMGVKTIRTVRQDAFVLPHEADKKVFIIKDAGCMNAAAQNALLKVLEEPPEYVMFILLCPVSSALLPTVLSRSVILSLSGVETDEGAAIVERIAGCDSATARAATENARGNIGKAVILAGKGVESPARTAATQFIDALFKQDEYALLKTLIPFEKDRSATDALFGELKSEICSRIKQLPKNGRRARALSGLFDDIEEFSQCARLNANLSLLFCLMAAKASEYMR